MRSSDWSSDVCSSDLRVVVGAVIEAQPLRDLSLVGLVEAIERFALEGRRRTQLRRRLSGVERRARGVAVHVDYAARNVGRDQRRAPIGGERLELDRKGGV